MDTIVRFNILKRIIIKIIIIIKLNLIGIIKKLIRIIKLLTKKSILELN
jgi:hypothetical protein